MIHLLTFPVALAGGELMEGVYEACSAGESAASCLVLAEDSLWVP